MRVVKRKGNALLTVVGMFAIMSILVVAMINGVMTSYELTKNSNDRLETFYSADSGIEIAYNELIRVTTNAIESGYKKVDEIRGGGAPLDVNRNFIDTSREGWENEVFKAEYKDYMEKNLEISIDNVNHDSVIYDEFSRKGKIIQVQAQVNNIVKEEKEKIGVYLKSTFDGEKGKSRAVEVDYKILVPDYGIREVFEKARGNSNIFDYIFAADGNVDLNLSTSFNVLGDMWVQGGELRNPSDPLSSGVLLSDKGINSAITWHGDIATNATVDIKDSNLEIPRNNLGNYNIYAKNFRYTGNPNRKRQLFNTYPLADEDTQNNKGLNLHVYNDFIFDGSNTDMHLKSFYGLNDITDDNYLNPNEEAKVASSMIIDSEDFGGVNSLTGENSSTSSRISVGSDTMILGTAYLNIAKNPLSSNEFFKTGESIVINRHSSPYTYRDYTENEYLYKYKGKLHMIDKLYKKDNYKDLTIVDKINLVKEFYNKNLNSQEKDKIVGLGKGISLNEAKTLTSGVAYDDGQVIQGHNEALEAKIDEKRKEFSKEVYFMRDEVASISDEDFKKARVVNTVGGNFNWDEVRKVINKGDIFEGTELMFKREDDKQNIKNGGTIFRGISAKTLVNNILSGEYIDGLFDAKVNVVLNYSNNDVVLRFNQAVPNDEKDPNKIYINLDAVGTANQYMYPTVVISKGDVIVERPKLPLLNGMPQNGSMTFTSLIYTAGDIEFNIEDGPTNVGNYMSDDTKLNRLFKAFFAKDQIAGRAFDGIFGGVESEEVEKVTNAEDLIEKGEWKLNK